jgi:hypothetical protein
VVVLDVRSNQLKSLPNSIGCLSKLKVLNVSGNVLQDLPATIEECRALEELNANFNQLTRLPDTLGFELHNLRRLSVNSSKLAYLPSFTDHMTALWSLGARLNCLCSLPDGLENLDSLETLNVSQNLQYLHELGYLTICHLYGMHLHICHPSTHEATDLPFLTMWHGSETRKDPNAPALAVHSYLSYHLHVGPTSRSSSTSGREHLQPPSGNRRA